MKSAIWATPGPRYANFGDVLQYLLIERYFKGKIKFELAEIGRPINTELIGQSKNLVVGPGGILVGTQGAKALYRNILNDKTLAKFDKYGTKFHIWSSGVLRVPEENERRLANELFSRCTYIATRANIEIDFIKSITPEAEPVFSPCSTMFLDKILKEDMPESMKSDNVVLNLNKDNFREGLYLRSPIHRFIEYANSEGLKCVLMANSVHQDTNMDMLKTFNLLRSDHRLEDLLIDYYNTIETQGHDAYPPGKLSAEVREYAFRNAKTFPRRYNKTRFAFGKRLHAWLPFFSYNTPAAFIGTKARRGMPKDYFGEELGEAFLCEVPERARNIGDLHRISEAMINKLRYYIKYEDRLVAKIAERREELWELFEKRAAELYESMD